MAIKGKKKPKSRSGRAVAAAPRPFLVPPKTPPFRRTGTKVLLVILIEAAVFGALLLAGAQSEEDAYRDHITQFGSLVESALYTSGAAQPLPAGPLVLPELGQTLSQLQAGEAKEKDVLDRAESWSEVTSTAAGDIAKIQAEGVPLTESRRLMQQGLRLYSALAGEIRVAAQLEGDAQTQLVETIGQQYLLAGEIFDAGYQKLQEERRKAGIPTESSPAGPLDPGVPFPAP